MDIFERALELSGPWFGDSSQAVWSLKARAPDPERQQDNRASVTKERKLTTTTTTSQRSPSSPPTLDLLHHLQATLSVSVESVILKLSLRPAPVYSVPLTQS